MSSFYNFFSGSSSNISRKYIQIFNNANDALYIEFNTGSAHWCLPQGENINSIAAFTHVNDSGDFFYETLSNREISSALPDEISNSARKNIAILERMDRSQCEAFIEKKFSPTEATIQKKEMNNYIYELSISQRNINNSADVPQEKADYDNDSSDDGDKKLKNNSDSSDEGERGNITNLTGNISSFQIKVSNINS